MLSCKRLLPTTVMALALCAPVAATDPSNSSQDFLEALRQGQTYRDSFAFDWDYQMTAKLLPGDRGEVLVTGGVRFVHSDGRFRIVSDLVQTGPDGMFVDLFGQKDLRFDGARLDRYMHHRMSQGQGQPFTTFDMANPDEQVFTSVQDIWAISSNDENVETINMIPLFGALPKTNNFWLDEFLAARDTAAEPIDTPCETCPSGAIGWRFYDDDVNIKVWLDPAKGHQITGLEAVLIRDAFYAPESTHESDYRETKLFNVEIANVSGHWVPVRGSYSCELPLGYYGVAQEAWDQVEKSTDTVRTDVDVQLSGFDFDTTYDEDYFRHEFPAGTVVHDMSAHVQLVAQADGRTLKRKTDPPEQVLARIQQEANEIRRLIRD